MQEATIKDAPEFLNTNDQAMWVLGYNEAVLKMQCKGCAVQEGYVPAEAVVQIQEPSPAPKNGYYDGDDDDEDGTPLFQSAEEVIRRSAEVRELRAGDVICIVQLVNDEHACQQHARLTAVDDPDAETELAWVFISNKEAKAYYEDKQAQKRTALHPKRVENVIFRMEMEGDTQAAETVQAQRDLIATLQSQLEAIGAGGVEPLRKPVQAVEPELVVEMSRKIAELDDQLIAEAARTAEQKLRADQLEKQHSMQSKMHAQASAQLAAVQQGVQPDWWRKRADEIEAEVARTGSINAMRCYTDMRALLQSATHPTQQGLDARELPAMTPELASILGLMCFQCIPFAQALRAGGQQINTRAEDEQAAVLHWMLGHYFRHGEAWRDAAAEDMERMKADAIAAQEKQGA